MMPVYELYLNYMCAVKNRKWMQRKLRHEFNVSHLQILPLRKMYLHASIYADAARYYLHQLNCYLLCTNGVLFRFPLSLQNVLRIKSWTESGLFSVQYLSPMFAAFSVNGRHGMFLFFLGKHSTITM